MTVTFNTKVRDHHWEANQLTLRVGRFRGNTVSFSSNMCSNPFSLALYRGFATGMERHCGSQPDLESVQTQFVSAKRRSGRASAGASLTPMPALSIEARLHGFSTQINGSAQLVLDLPREHVVDSVLEERLKEPMEFFLVVHDKRGKCHEVDILGLVFDDIVESGEQRTFENRFNSVCHLFQQACEADHLQATFVLLPVYRHATDRGANSPVVKGMKVLVHGEAGHVIWTDDDSCWQVFFGRSFLARFTY